MTAARIAAFIGILMWLGLGASLLGLTHDMPDGLDAFGAIFALWAMWLGLPFYVLALHKVSQQ
jgi:hypothetical protein